MEPNPASSARGIATLGPSVTQHLAQADYTRSRPHLYEEPIGTVASSSRSSTHPTRSSSLTKIPQPGQSAEPSDTREASEPVTRSMALEQPICSSTPYGTPQYQPSIAASSSFGPRAGSIPGNKSLPESLYGFDPNDHLPQASSPREASAGSQIGILTRKRGNTTKAPSHTASREPSGVKPEPRSVSKPKRMDQPQLPSQKNAKITPATAMYYTSIPFHTLKSQQSLRAHTGTLVGDRIWFIGGVNAKHCWREVAYYDTGSLEWNTVETGGEQLPPLRAHTTTLVGDKLYIFGGGDGPTYSNEVWMFDTVSYRFSQPTLTTPKSAWPPPRRAHTTVLYRNFLVVFGGGNGQAALNDVWALDVSDPDRLTWHEWQAKGTAPQKKGYHTANLVGDRMVVFGGSDGHASFADVHILNLRTLTWTLINTELKFNRLSHTSTLVGSYLFMLGGHNGQSYAQDVLLFNLVTLQWESKHPGGVPPPGRGYHIALLHDARIYVQGGYNGVSVFGDLWALELGASAYLPQVTTFEIDETVAVAAAAAAA